jgi:hypothetical protein
MREDFREGVFQPQMIVFTTFTLTVLIDNTLYFLKGAMLSNFSWGSYHNIPRILDSDSQDAQ